MGVLAAGSEFAGLPRRKAAGLSPVLAGLPRRETAGISAVLAGLPWRETAGISAVLAGLPWRETAGISAVLVGLRVPGASVAVGMLRLARRATTVAGRLTVAGLRR